MSVELLEHPFAPYVRALGKGRRGMRDLTREEAQTAMGMVFSGAVEPVQLGAFLMLLRVKEETPAEVAGFVAAARAAALPYEFPAVDLDWACYAGKRRQLPWLVLAAVLLAEQGVRMLLHGPAPGQDAQRVYVPQALQTLGFPLAQTLDQVRSQLERWNFSWLGLPLFHPGMQRLLDLRAQLGLRSPLHTVARMLNPGRAATSMLGVFHPGYDRIHQQAALLLVERNLAAFKGEGGESELDPDAETEIHALRAGEPMAFSWPKQFTQRHLRAPVLDCQPLVQVWRGEASHEYGVEAVCATTALALWAMGRAPTPEVALAQARAAWERRQRQSLPFTGADS